MLFSFEKIYILLFSIETFTEAKKINQKCAQFRTESEKGAVIVSVMTFSTNVEKRTCKV